MPLVYPFLAVFLFLFCEQVPARGNWDWTLPGLEGDETMNAMSGHTVSAANIMRSHMFEDVTKCVVKKISDLHQVNTQPLAMEHCIHERKISARHTSIAAVK